MSFDQPSRRTSLRLGVLTVLLLVCCLGVIIIGIVLQLTGDDSSDVEKGDAIIYGLTLNPSGFDPHIHASNELGIPFFSVYDTLVYRHPEQMNFVPGLAERWQMAPDGLSWTFFLRQDVTFHDGTPFNAQAVAVNLDRITNPEIGSQKALFLLGPYTGYEIIDAYTIVLKLSEPYAPLLDALSQVYLGIASPQALSEYTKNTYQWHQVGTGPYMLDDLVAGDHVTLRRNPDYNWGPVFYAPETDASLDTIEFRFFTDPTSRSLALESGELQVVGELLPADAELLAGNTALRIFRVPIPGTPQQFFFNTSRSPVDNVNLRQALLYGTNRTAIVDAVFGGQSPVAYGPLSSVTPLYAPEITGLYPFDTEYARALLSGLGYQDSDGDSFLDLEGEPLRLTVVFGPWNQMADVAQLIQSQWLELGIDVRLIQAADFTDLVKYANEGNYDLIAFSDFAVDASVLNRYYLTDGPNNWAHFSDPEVDGWLLEAERQPDEETRDQLYASVQQRIMEQAVVLPVREYVNLVGTSARLDGVIFSAQGWWPLLRNFLLTP